MILNKIFLNQFAGIVKNTVQFEEGLNVLLGPNEAGKSTIIHALRMVLFMPTNYNKRTLDNEISLFMPLVGGDTIRVSLDFTVGSGRCQLSRSWGSQRQSELNALGSLITDPDEIQDAIQKMLGFGLHTFETVVCASQACLGSTINDLGEDSQTVDQLASVIRRLVLETDGVSIERLGELLIFEYESYFNHWDIALQRPDRDRGIDDPWRQKIGRILDYYYQLENTKRRLEEIKAYYQELADLSKKNAALAQEVTGLQEWVDTNEPIVTNLREYMLLEETHKRIEAEKQPLASAVNDWMQLEAGMKVKRDMPLEIKRKLQLLEDELTQAHQAQAIQEKINKYNEAKIKKESVDEAKKKLTKIADVKEKTYSELTGLYNHIEQLKMKLEGGKLSLVVTANKPMDVNITRDLEPIEAIHIDSAPLQVTTGSKIIVEHTDWKMEVRSGIIDFEEIQKDFNESSKTYESTLKKLGFGNLEETKEAYDKYQSVVHEVAILEAQLEQVLSGDSYSELKKSAKAPGQSISLRPLEIISAELAKENSALEHLENEIRTINDKIETFKKEYVTNEKLMEIYAEKLGELKTINLRLKKLGPAPSGIGEPKEFIELWESKKVELGQNQTEFTGCLIDKAKLEAQAPQESEAELIEQIQDIETLFNQAKQKGYAIIEVQKVFNRIKESIDKEPLAPWLKSLEENLGPVTMGRFNTVSLDNNIPGRAIRADGVEVPIDKLSVGTLVGLGLSLRLSMAKYFLGEGDGFVIMDDPLVDMDPDRQKATATVLQNCAKHMQVIIVTCHPDNANLMGGNLINFESPPKLDTHRKNQQHKTRSRRQL